MQEKFIKLGHLMNNYFFPDDLSFRDIIFPEIFNEPSFVQFIHRKLAYIIFLYVLVISFLTFYKKNKEMYNSVYFLISNDFHSDNSWNFYTFKWGIYFNRLFASNFNNTFTHFFDLFLLQVSQNIVFIDIIINNL